MKFKSASSDPRVTSIYTRLMSSNPRIRSLNPQVRSSNSRVTSSDPRLTSSNSRVTSSDQWVTSSNPRVTSSRIIKSMKTQVNDLRKWVLFGVLKKPNKTHFLRS